MFTCMVEVKLSLYGFNVLGVSTPSSFCITLKFGRLRVRTASRTAAVSAEDDSNHRPQRGEWPA